MTQLKSLDLGNNSLKDISAINSLQNLTDLYLGGDNNNVDLTQIEDKISTLRSVNEKSFQTIVKCNPEKVTKITFTFHGYGGKLPDELYKLTSLTELSFPQCGVTNLDALSNVTSLTSLTLGCNLHEGMIKDFSKLTNLTYLHLRGNNLWSEDLENLKTLKNNKNLTIDLVDNAIIDASALLELDASCIIKLGGNVNLSQESKTALTGKFGKNVSF